jgi:hypothetical protein
MTVVRTVVKIPSITLVISKREIGPGEPKGPLGPPGRYSPEELQAIVAAYERDPELLMQRLVRAVDKTGLGIQELEKLMRERFASQDSGEEDIAAAIAIFTSALVQVRKQKRRQRMARHEQPAAIVLQFPGERESERVSDGTPNELEDEPTGNLVRVELSTDDDTNDDPTYVRVELSTDPADNDTGQ